MSFGWPCVPTGGPDVSVRTVCLVLGPGAGTGTSSSSHHSHSHSSTSTSTSRGSTTTRSHSYSTCFSIISPYLRCCAFLYLHSDVGTTTTTTTSSSSSSRRRRRRHRFLPPSTSSRRPLHSRHLRPTHSSRSRIQHANDNVSIQSHHEHRSQFEKIERLGGFRFSRRSHRIWDSSLPTSHQATDGFDDGGDKVVRIQSRWTTQGQVQSPEMGCFQGDVLERQRGDLGRQADLG